MAAALLRDVVQCKSVCLHDLPCSGSLEAAQSLGPPVFLTTPHVEDALFIFRICLNVFFSKSDAVEVGVAQLSV